MYPFRPLTAQQSPRQTDEVRNPGKDTALDESRKDQGPRHLIWARSSLPKELPDHEPCSTTVDTLRTEQGDQGLRVSVPIESHPGEDFAVFIWLADFGNFRAAFEFFENNLVNHCDMFSVFAENADCLLQQGNFYQLRYLLQLNRRWFELSYQRQHAEEVWVLRLFHTITEIHCEGSLKLALATAREWHQLSAQSYLYSPATVSQRCQIF
jgi:hypothetical protein